MTTNFRRPLPARVIQTGPWDCWAASFQAWNQANGLTRSAPSQAETVALLSPVRSWLNSATGGATEAGIRTLIHLGFMEMDIVGQGRLTCDYMYKRLQRGYVYLAYKPAFDGGSSGHVVVVYGVDDGGIYVVDPDVANCYPARIPEDWMARRTSAIVGVPILGPFTNITNPFAGMTTRS